MIALSRNPNPMKGIAFATATANILNNITFEILKKNVSSSLERKCISFDNRLEKIKRIIWIIIIL